MAVGDVYSVKLFGNYQGTDNLNVFNYKVVDGGGGVDDAPDLADIFNTVVQSKVANVAVISQTYNRIEVFKWSDPANFDTISSGDLDEGIGLRAGEGMTSIVAWSFSYVRVSPGQRSGGKRIPGISETDLNGYVPIAGAVTVLNALAVAMAQTLFGVNARYDPFVAKRPLVLGINPLGYIPTTVSFAGVGSQVSRKRTLASQ